MQQDDGRWLINQPYGMPSGDNSLSGLLAQFQPTEEDRKAARRQAILAASLGLLGAQRGYEGHALQQAGLLGMGTYNNQLAGSQKAALERMQMAAEALKLKQGYQDYQDNQGARDVLKNAYSNTGMPGVPIAQPSYGMGDRGTGMAPPAAPQAAPAPDLSKQSKFEQYSAIAQQLAAKGFVKQAQQYADMAEKFRPQLDSQKVYTDPNTGQRQVVNVYKDGTIKPLSDIAPDKEKLHFGSNGASGEIGFDPMTGQQVSPGVPMQISPETQLRVDMEGRGQDITVRGQNMTDARARELNAINRAAANTGQLVETPQGFARVGKDNTVTPITVGGEQLQTKPSGAVQQQVASNNVTLQKVSRALQELERNPDAVGVKNYLPDSIVQRMDPKGVDARAMIADIAGQKIHDRSGAAVTVSESARLRPYVPNPTDDVATVRKKLVLFQKEYVAMQRELTGGKSLADVAGQPMRSSGGSVGGWSAVQIK